MNFTHFEFVWLALLLPFFAAALLAGHKLRLQAKRVYGSEDLLPKAGKRQNRERGAMHPVGVFAAGCLIVIAAMGPVLSSRSRRVYDGSLQAVVVLDVSRSMAAEDYRDSMPLDAGEKPDLNQVWGSRLEMAKFQILEIMKSIKGSHLGIVNYAEQGFPQADLSSDFDALRFVLKNWVVQGNAPGAGSHIENGIREALATFQRDAAPGKSRVLILMSDGGSDGDKGALSEAVAELKRQNIRLVVVGLGLPGEHPIPVYEGGRLNGYFSVDDKAVLTSYDEATLRAIAADAGGAYEHVEPLGKSGVSAVDWGAQLGGFRTEKSEIQLFPYFGGAAFAVVLLLSAAGLRRSKE